LLRPKYWAWAATGSAARRSDARIRRHTS
jgi:hypothetical protein